MGENKGSIFVKLFGLRFTCRKQRDFTNEQRKNKYRANSDVHFSLTLGKTW